MDKELIKLAKAIGSFKVNIKKLRLNLWTLIT